MLRETSSSSVKIISIQREEILERLRLISRRICQLHKEVHSIHLFGSLVRGDQVGTSDADVLTLLHDPTDDHQIDLIRRYLKYFNLPIGTDLIVIDNPSFSQRLAADDPFISRLWQESVQLA